MKRAFVLVLALLAGAAVALAITTLPAANHGADTAAAATTMSTTATIPTTTGSDAGATWQLQAAQAPPPPSGQAPSPYPVALGSVGDIEFWSPNQGLLITGGTQLVPAGLYAYDGSTWHELSSVCGSGDGRIAYVSADEWWTISDQLPGQTLVSDSSNPTQGLTGISLCHFKNGQVVASYGMPLDQANSYPQMNAAACVGANDCWFAGNFSASGDDGAFHLYWNGSTLTEVDDTTEEAATSSMVTVGPTIYESVQLPTTTTNTATTVLHSIVPADPSNPFHNVVIADNSCTGFCPTLPDYGTSTTGTAIQPNALGAFQLSSDAGASAGPARPGQLWAAAEPASSNGAHSIVLRDTGGNWTEIVPTLTSFPANERPQEIAADPGENAAWVTIDPLSAGGNPGAFVGLLQSIDGGNTWDYTEQDELGPAQNLGDLGSAGPITCPAAHNCWLATTDGWLFHLTNGTQLSQSTDPIYNGSGGIIDYRPNDSSSLVLQQATLPTDNSLANQQAAQTQTDDDAGTDDATSTSTTVASKALISSQKLSFNKKTNEITVKFTLTATARIQLVATRLEHLYKTGHKKVRVKEKYKVKERVKAHGKYKVNIVTKTRIVSKTEKTKIPTKKTKTVTVAQSKLRSFKSGTHSIKLKLNPKRWPTSVHLNVPGESMASGTSTTGTGTDTGTIETDTGTGTGTDATSTGTNVGTSTTSTKTTSKSTAKSSTKTTKSSSKTTTKPATKSPPKTGKNAGNRSSEKQ